MTVKAALEGVIIPKRYQEDILRSSHIRSHSPSGLLKISCSKSPSRNLLLEISYLSSVVTWIVILNNTLVHLTVSVMDRLPPTYHRLFPHLN